jgi:hypothetical protein
MMLRVLQSVSGLQQAAWRAVRPFVFYIGLCHWTVTAGRRSEGRDYLDSTTALDSHLSNDVRGPEDEYRKFRRIVSIASSKRLDDYDAYAASIVRNSR